MAEENEIQRVVIEGVKIDLSNVTVKEWAEFTDLENARLLPLAERAKRQAGYLTKMVKSLPEEWGDPADVETYLNLDMFGQWLPLVTMLWQSVEDERKKAITRYTTR